MAGVVIGTEGYMSPEQVRGLAADHRSDIFAFGAILYEMLSGRRAFHGDTTMDTMMAIAKDAPPELNGSDRTIPPGLARIVNRCLEKNPAARFQSMRDLAFALEGLSAPSDGVAALAARPRITRERVAWLVALGAVAALAATVYIGVSSTSTTIQPRHVAVLSPEGTRVLGSLALSPDGRALVFEACKADGSSALYAQTLGVADAKLLSGTENASDPFFSPDGLSVAFFAEQKLKRINLSEGAPQTIAAAPDPRWELDFGRCDRVRAKWGRWLVPGIRHRGAAAPLTHLDPKVHDVSHRWPRFLPDGRHFVFLERTAGGQNDRLFMVASSLDNPAQIIRIAAGDSSPVYYDGKMIFPREGGLFVQPFDLNTLQLTGSPSAIAPDAWISADVDGLTALGAAGDVIAFRRAKSEERQLEWMDAEGRQLGTVGPVNVDEARLSPDGHSAAVIVSERLRSQTAGLWLIDLARGVTSRFTPTPRNEVHPVWSPDGSRIAFTSDRLGNFDLYLRALNARDDTLLLKSSHWKYPDDWSSDGKWLMYEDIDPATKRNLYALPMTGTPTPVPVLQSGANEWFARFSPDGRWVAYTSDESGRDEIYVQSFPSVAKKYTISTAGGMQPAWRRDGHVLYYLSGDNHIMRVDIAVIGPTLSAAKPVPLFQASLYHRNASGVYWWFDPTADGSRFIVAALNQNARASAIDLLIGQR
jgi:Tol biopolymer transport system component